MKTILKLSLVVLVALTTMNTYAIDGDFLLIVNKGTSKEISFSLNAIQQANVTIYDKKGNVVFTELTPGNSGILKTYSLDKFPDGIYFLEVETNLKRVIHKIVIDQNVSTLSRTSIAEVSKAEMKIKNQKIVDNY